MGVPIESGLGPARVVSHDDEALILVNAQDEAIGSASKRQCHDGEGQLHRAFSVFLFDDQGRLLIQRRGADKRLWPGFWANSCCSHPRAGESMTVATQRRMAEELGVSAALSFLYKFEYHARYLDLGAEHELCWVHVGRVHTDQVRANPAELAEWTVASAAQINAMMADASQPMAPWFRLEWQALAGPQRSALEAALGLRVFG